MRASDTLSDALRKLKERVRFAQVSDTPALSLAELGAELELVIAEVTERESELSDQNQALRDSQVTLAASHNRYLELFDRAPACYFTVDPEGVVVDANLAAATCLGVAREQLVGRALLSFVTPSSQPTLERHLRRAFTTGWRNGSDLTFARADGGTVEMYLETAALPGQHGDADSLLLAAIDITARKQVERALRASEEKYRTLFDDCRDGILALDERWNIVDANASACALFGLPLRELARRSLWRLFPHELADAQLAVLCEEAMATEPRLRELWVATPDAGRVLVETSLTAGAGAEGRVYQLVVRDVTSRRTRDADRMAAQREEYKLDALSRLAGGVAHDFGNVLTAVQGLASAMLGDVPADSVLREDLDAILAANRRGCELNRALLTFARRESPRKGMLLLSPIVREACEAAQPGSQPSARMFVDLDEAVVVDGDPTQVAECLGHLLRNALEAMPSGGELRVTLARARDALDPRVDVARLCIRDSGVGMDHETRDRAFEPLFTTKPHGTSIGMGLAHAYRTIRNHGGTMSVDSAPDCGTLVTIDLPISLRVEQEAQSPPPYRHSARSSS